MWREEIMTSFYWILIVVVPRAAVWRYVIASYLGLNRIFKIFNTKWSYDKMLIDWGLYGNSGTAVCVRAPSNPGDAGVQAECW